MKKTVSIILSLIMMLSLTLTGCAAEHETTTVQGNTEIILQIGNPLMAVNGTEKEIDNEGTTPLIQNGRTLLPVRAIIEEIGGSVAWNGEKKEVTLNYGDDEIKLTIDNTDAFQNGNKVVLDTAPTIIGDRTMLPIRFIAESFKFDVKWEAETQKVIITKEIKATEQPVNIEDETASSGNKSAVMFFFVYQ